jgi:acyl-CoA thioesterase I
MSAIEWLQFAISMHRMNHGKRRSIRVPAGLGRRIAAACIVLALIGPSGALAQSAVELCLAANRDLSLGTRLPRTSARLKAGAPMMIVAVGSSSTTGLWVLSSSATYPGVLQRELTALQPAGRIEVVNSGHIGDTISGSIARFQNDVLAYRPDLVIWQLGTNDVAWGGRADGLDQEITGGVRILKSAGADIILMDLQYSALVLASSQSAAVQEMISRVAREQRVGLFSRFLLMRRSIDAGVPASALVAWDGLHNSAEGYDCVGRALARAILAAGR